MTSWIRSTFRRLPVAGRRLVASRLRLRVLSVQSREAPGSAAVDAAYASWIEQHDLLDDRDLEAASAYGAALASRPLISVVLAVSDPAEPALRAAIASVLAQVYENWELCIADDACRSRAVRRILGEVGANNGVRVVRRSRSAGIAAASNDAAGLATGSHIVLLDQAGVLRAHALLLLADELNRHPDSVLVYSDEDRLDGDGARCDHDFKPDWNPALVLSRNYVGRLLALSRDLFDRVGGFRPAFGESADWDLVLRVTEGVAPRRIRHVPHVLYHRCRGDEAEPAADAVEAGRRAVEDALRRRGEEATVTSVHGRYQRVRYRLPDPAPRVDVVVPTGWRHDFVRPCLDGLLRETDYRNITLTVALARSVLDRDEAAEYLERIEREDPRVRLFVYDDRPFNYAWVNNCAAAGLDGSLLLLVNDDVRVIHRDWLDAMVGQVLREGVGAVGPMLYYPDDRVQHGGVILGAGAMVADHYHRFLPRGEPGYQARAWLDQDLSCVTGGCVLLRREAFDTVGGFDETLAVAFNDVDLCLRLVDRGWRVVWTPAAELYHHESISVGPADGPERAALFEHESRLMFDRWSGRLLADPQYNPNLSLLALNTPALPPRVPYPWAGGPRSRPS